ncbi:MAG: glycosyltransferase family 2 protein [Mucilaginibacter sp.]
MNIAVQPLVSIALCTFQGKNFLKKQLESLLSQTYRNIEIIAVDDCSVDHTWAILQDYAETNPKLKIYRNDQNIGYSRNFEKAIKLCKGDYIALADQDDIWESNKIEILMAAIKDNIMVYHNSDFIDEQDNRIGDITMASKRRMYEGESCLPFVLSNCISGHTTLFKRELIPYILPFESDNYHDWWIAYVAFNIGKVKFIDKVLVHYRQHKDSITDTLQIRNSKRQERLTIDPLWLKYCADFKYNKESVIVKRAYTLLSALKDGKSRLQTLLFLVKYFDLFFYIDSKKRGFFSKVNYVRKICFG